MPWWYRAYPKFMEGRLAVVRIARTWWANGRTSPPALDYSIQSLGVAGRRSRLAPVWPIAKADHLLRRATCLFTAVCVTLAARAAASPFASITNELSSTVAVIH